MKLRLHFVLLVIEICVSEHVCDGPVNATFASSQSKKKKKFFPIVFVQLEPSSPPSNLNRSKCYSEKKTKKKSTKVVTVVVVFSHFIFLFREGPRQTIWTFWRFHTISFSLWVVEHINRFIQNLEIFSSVYYYFRASDGVCAMNLIKWWNYAVVQKRETESVQFCNFQYLFDRFYLAPTHLHRLCPCCCPVGSRKEKCQPNAAIYVRRYFNDLCCDDHSEPTNFFHTFRNILIRLSRISLFWPSLRIHMQNIYKMRNGKC